MKKIILSIALLGGISYGASAQSTFSIGLRGGVNLSTLQNEDLEDNKYMTGMNFAIPIEIGLSENFAIQPEIMFTQKGVAFDYNDFTPAIDIQTRSVTNYFEVPLLFKAKVGGDNLKAYVAAGPTFGYAISRSNVTIIDGERETETIDLVTDGEIKDNQFDLGASFGLGFEISAGPGAFVIDARYNMDFNDNTSFKNDKPDTWENTTNSGIGLNLGYMFKF